MSYDVSLTIDTGAPYRAQVVDVGNMTSNVGPMFRKALGGRGLLDLIGQRAGAVIERLTAAIDDMTSNVAAYEELNPPNGWGSASGATEFLKELLKQCTEHPKTTIEIHY